MAGKKVTGGNQHDAFVGKVFRVKKNLYDFLDFSLPENVKSTLDLTHITYDDTTYISRNLKKRYSDIVIKTKYEGEEAGIYVLIEHKSGFRRKEDALVQVLHYISLMMQSDIDNDKPLRVILPLIIYHGTKPWGAPPSMRELFTVDEAVMPFIVDFKYILFDTKVLGVTDSELQRLHYNIDLFSALTLLKISFDDEEYKNHLAKLFKLWYNNGMFEHIHDAVYLLEYLFSIRDLKNDELEEILTIAQLSGGTIMPTLLDEWKKQGELEGRLEAKLEAAKEMLEMNFEIDTIVKITKLPREEIEKLAAEL